MYIRKVEIIEDNGKTTIKLNGEELHGVTFLQFSKSSTGAAELSVKLEIIREMGIVI